MKNLKIIILLLGGLLVLGSLSSCSDDNNETTPEMSKAASAKVEYVVTLSQSVLDASAVTVYYFDSNGQQAQETVTTSLWTKTVNFATLPAKAGFSVQPALKDQPSKEVYDIEASGQIKIIVLDQKSSNFGNPYVGNKLVVKGQLGPDYLGQFLSRISTLLNEGKAIGADGSISDTAITWGGNAEGNDPNRDIGISSYGATGKTR